MSVKTNNRTLTLRLTWSTILIALLLVSNVASLLLWKPWQSKTTSARKITMTGEATIKATPDEYILSPYFEFANADRTKANEELAAKASAITAKLKEFGVTDEQIKSNTNGYDKYYTTEPANNSDSTLMLQYTITLSSKETAEKVQNYMLELKAEGQISPLAQFSETKRKELEVEARDKAIEDAKAKAEKTASRLNAKVGKVTAFSDGAGYGGGPVPLTGSVTAIDSRMEVSSSASLPVQVGQEEFRYSVTVEYELK